MLIAILISDFDQKFRKNTSKLVKFIQETNKIYNQYKTIIRFY